MFNFIKKSSSSSSSSGGVGGGESGGSGEKEGEKERRKRDKKERKEQAKRDRLSMSPEELLRLDEVRKSLKLTRRRKDKEKLPSGITADYTADFLASLARVDPPPPPPMDSSESVRPPTLPPKPPKRGILKTPKGCGAPGGAPHSPVEDDARTLLRNTLQNEVIAYQNVPAGSGGGGVNGLLAAVTSPSNDSLTDTTNSSFATPPFSLSPVGESQGFHRWSRTPNFDEVDLPLPAIVPLELPAARVLRVPRQRPPRSDFGFSLRRAMVLERRRRLQQRQCATPDDNANGADDDDGEEEVTMRAVIFAEPGATPQHQNETGLLPGDKLLAVNGVRVAERSREDIIDLIKASGECVTLTVQPVAELSELSRRSTHDGRELLLDDASIKCGTLRRSGSRRFNATATAKTEEQIANEQQWLDNELVWLMHRGGFTLCRRLAPSTGGKVQVAVAATGETLAVDEDDVEVPNPPQFDRAEDLAALQQLNETSLLHTLRQRFANSLIHTYAGAANLLVVNPMKPLAIYSEKVVALFRGCQLEDLPPHVYSMAQAAYHCMLQSRKDQSLVFVGRSGAGKTTNFRHCAHYLVACAATPPTAGGLTLEKLAAVWQLLEAFGNCRTLANANATRFAHVLSLDFDAGGALASASVQPLLVERQRVCRRPPDGETAFHVLQRLLCGAEGRLRRDLLLDGEVATAKLEERQRAQVEFTKLQHALSVLGVNEMDARALWRLVASVHHLVSAGAAKVTGATGRYQFAQPQCAQRAAHLLAVSVEELARSIFQSTSTANAEQELELNGGDALDSFVMSLYAEAFHSVVALVNRALATGAHSVVASIRLVDSAGFQNPATCGRQTGASLDDLCHNYVQERLQLLAHHANVVQPRDRYAQEHVDVPAATAAASAAQSAAALVSLLDDADRRGLLLLLDEEALRVDASDESFVERVCTHFGEQRDHQLLLRRAPGHCQFVLQHMLGTNPVLYSATGWLRQSRESAVERMAAVASVLAASASDELRALLALTTASTCGSLIESANSGTQSLRRATSVRRTASKSACLQTKFAVDALVETVRRTKLRFVHCLLPQHGAGQCDPGTPPGALNVPLLRSQIRGAQILDTIRLHKQGFPMFMPLGEFRRRFRLLAGENGVAHVVDERTAVEEMLATMDVDGSGYRVGLSLIFFRSGVLAELEHERDERVAGVVVKLQAHCRGYLARKRLAQRRLAELAVRCVQRNVRKFLSVRDWPWWRLLVRVAPLLNVHRADEELKAQAAQLVALRAKLDRVEAERAHLKLENERLEAKLSEITVDLAEEHSTATLATERLDAEAAARARAERELSEATHRNKELAQQSERLEMELLYARADLNGIDEEDEFADGSANGGAGGNEAGDGGVYRQRYERAARELEFTKRRLQQQHEDDLEQLVGMKKQLEKKLSDAYEEVEEQRQVVGQWKRKVAKLNGEMADLKHLLEEQSGRNNLLEKKQRRFDAEAQQLHEELRQERAARERLGREREQLAAEKSVGDGQLVDARLELELRDERCATLQRELDELACGTRTDEEAALLRKQKLECERRVHDQEEELDELAGQVQLLEQAKLKLEMALEQARKQAKRDAAAHDEELEAARATAQKRARALEAQLEAEHAERTCLLRERHELERRLAAAVERTSAAASDEALVARLRRDLRRTKALLRDAHAQLERARGDQQQAGRHALVRQLRHQVDELECARGAAAKARATLEAELGDAQHQLEEAVRARADAEERLGGAARDRNELQAQLDENEEELAEVLKRYKASVQQASRDQLALHEHVGRVAELEAERVALREQLAELASRLESAESVGDASATALVRRAELRAKELEGKLQLELTTRQRQDVQAARLREAADRLQAEAAAARAKEAAAQADVRRLQRASRELRDEHNAVLARDADALLKRKELEKRCETLEAEAAAARADLRLALKRIEDLQAAIQGDLDDDDDSIDNSDSYSSDDSVNTFLANHNATATPSLQQQQANGGGGGGVDATARKLSSSSAGKDGYA